jgi:two-component system, cell cycle response regulator
MMDSDHFELVLIYPNHLFQKWELSSEKISIGRSQVCRIALEDEWVSRRHCEIWLENNQVRLQDLGSTNGTYVNGTQVQNAVLDGQSQIQIGRAIFKVEMSHSSGWSQTLPEYILKNEELHSVLDPATFLDKSRYYVHFAEKSNQCVTLLTMDILQILQDNQAPSETLAHRQFIMREFSRLLLRQKDPEDLLSIMQPNRFMLLVTGESAQGNQAFISNILDILDSYLFSYEDSFLTPVFSRSLCVRENGEKGSLEDFLARGISSLEKPSIYASA